MENHLQHLSGLGSRRTCATGSGGADPVAFPRLLLQKFWLVKPKAASGVADRRTEGARGMKEKNPVCRNSRDAARGAGRGCACSVGRDLRRLRRRGQGERAGGLLHRLRQPVLRMAVPGAQLRRTGSSSPGRPRIRVAALMHETNPAGDLRPRLSRTACARARARSTTA